MNLKELWSISMIEGVNILNAWFVVIKIYQNITNRRCFPRFCKQDIERVLVATNWAVYSYCLHLNSICREDDESLLVRRGTEYFSGRFSLWFSLSFAKRQWNYWKQFLTGHPFRDELSTGRVYFKHCFRQTEMRAFRKRLLLFLVTLAFKVSICNLSDPTILTFLWSTGGRLYIVFNMNKIVDRNCQFHANFYCYSFLCIQYQILSSETTNITGSLYLAPGTQHCLQEKSTCRTFEIMRSWTSTSLSQHDSQLNLQSF